MEPAAPDAPPAAEVPAAQQVHETPGFLFVRFLRYGYLAWGGPVAQIALMHKELVEQHRWVSEERFRKTLALYQALPGPEAHELAVYFGMVRGGRWGGFLSGLGFMLPGAVLVTLLAALYVAYRDVNDYATILLYGVRPAVIALIAVGFLRLARRSVPTLPLAAVALGAATVGTLVPSVNFVLILLVGGLLAALPALARRPPVASFALFPILAVPVATASALLALGLLSLKVGLLTFGGAYTAIPFLQRTAVDELGWMTNAEFLDALALVGMVPGPLICIGTFVGYVAAGPLGALVATAIIFAPAFVFTLVGHSFFERIIHEPRLHAFLLGVTAAVVGLILTSLVAVGRAGLVDGVTVVMAAIAAFLLITDRVKIPWVVLGGAVIGAAARWIGATIPP